MSTQNTKKKAPEFGLTYKKEENFGAWYQQLVIKSELLEYYDIKGCFIMRPWSFFMWSVIKDSFTRDIEKMGVDECYFPLLVTKAALEKEENHIENFAPELAWITKCGTTDIEPVAIRPTSEAVMYPYFKKWLFSHRDLPLKLNQWCNVLRWEVKSTFPFIRGREFLWQEGHTAHYDKADAEKEVLEILDLYAKVYTDLLAVPVIKGMKTENEKFGGAVYTTTIETFIPTSGRAIQAATSHFLGQNFSKMYDVKIVDMANKEAFVYQNSWGLTTRSIGISTMIHSDDIGLVLPPRVSKIQAVIIPCGPMSKEIEEYILTIKTEIAKSGIRVFFDEKKHVGTGFKFNHWEIKGVPLRLEIGKKDFDSGKVTVCVRMNKEKKRISATNIGQSIAQELERIHHTMYEKARLEQLKRIKRPSDWKEFEAELARGNMALFPFCGIKECEENIKNETTVHVDGVVEQQGAKSLCVPFENNEPRDLKCLKCAGKCQRLTLFGRSY